MSSEPNPAAVFSSLRVAVLHQGGPTPPVHGVSKPPKPGGYQDSGADIAFALQKAGVSIATPIPDPKPSSHSGWTFPDTIPGIFSAVEAHKANVLWCNTTLYATHPLVLLRRELSELGVWFVGQDPKDVERFEDKAWCNSWLQRQEGLETVFPKRWLVWKECKEEWWETISLPAVVKPVRGRGSYGVTMVKTKLELKQKATELFKEGDLVLFEEYLPGEEITVTVMPPGDFPIVGSQSKHWALPVVRRFNHQDGIAPYNGVVAVTANSRIVTQEEFDGDPEYQEAARMCELVAEKCGSFAPIRVDARRKDLRKNSPFLLFDVNMKPNATGPGRPNREDQASLTLLAAQALGWDYPTLLLGLLGAAKSFSGTL